MVSPCAKSHWGHGGPGCKGDIGSALGSRVFHACGVPDAEFQYPASWLVDQRLFRRAAEQAERRRPLDPPSLRCAWSTSQLGRALLRSAPHGCSC
jgi:hypothetical protein